MGHPSNWVVNSIRQKLNSLPALSPLSCIYRVPENLRKVNEEAYQPLHVSIGPFHYNQDPKLLLMQHQKLRYLQSFLQRNNAYHLDYYVDVLRGWEDLARNCYVETINLASEHFIEMLLIDASFIIELFLRGSFPRYIDENDGIFKKPMMKLEVTRDIRLEENQLPFFILRNLYDLAIISSPQNEHLPFVDLTYRFLTGKTDAVPQNLSNIDIKHLVDFLRMCYLPSTFSRDHPNQTVVISITEMESKRGHLNGSQKFMFSPSVTELREAGVKFKVSTIKDLLDVRFTKGVLEIPRFVVSDETESLFRNIMVFEQCHYYFDSYVIDYFAFLDGLINTPRDVEILVRNGIIENWLGSNEEVAKLFNNIFKQTRLSVGNFYYLDVCRDLNAYASTSWHQWKATLKHNYFNHPWAAISVVYAIVMLILTVIQAITGFK